MRPYTSGPDEGVERDAARTANSCLRTCQMTTIKIPDVIQRPIGTDLLGVSYPRAVAKGHSHDDISGHIVDSLEAYEVDVPTKVPGRYAIACGVIPCACALLESASTIAFNCASVRLADRGSLRIAARIVSLIAIDVVDEVDWAYAPDGTTVTKPANSNNATAKQVIAS